MKYIFGITGVLFNIAGAVVMSASTSVMVEMCSLVLILIGTLNVGIGGIISKLDELKPKVGVTQWPTEKEEVIELTDCISN